MDWMTLQSALRQKRVVVFCGAGISIEPPAGLPNWHQLRDHTLDAVAGRHSTSAKFTSTLKALEMLAEPGKRGLTPEVVASEIERTTRRYFDALRGLDDGAPNANHVLLARLAKANFISVLITTNFDRFLERALDQEGVPFRVYRTEEEISRVPQGPAACEDVHVVKLHGCLSLPKTITATVEQEARGLSPAKSHMLDSLLREFWFLFWGYSGADLKIDLDYLRMVSASKEAKGFIWNLYRSADFQETPSPNLLSLQHLYADHGIVEVGLLPRALEGLVEPPPRQSYTMAEQHAWMEQKTLRLKASLDGWAIENVFDFEACALIGHLLQMSGLPDEATECFEQMLALGQASNTASVVGAALNNLGNIDKAAGRNEVAAKRFRESLKYRPDGLERIIVLRNLGDIYSGVGAAAEATATYDEAEQLAGVNGDQESIARVYAGRAFLCQVTGHRDEAVSWYRRAEAKAASIGAKGFLGECLLNRGAVHRFLGELEEAQQCFEKAGEIARMLGDKAGVGYAMRSAGGVLLTAGKQPDARDHFERARQIAEQIKDKRLLVDCLNNLATVDMFENHMAEAEARLHRAEALSLEIIEYPSLAGVLMNQLSLYAHMQRWQDAVDAGRKAVKVLEGLNDRALAAMAYRDTAGIYLRELHQPHQAAYGYRIALTYARLEGLTEVPEIMAALEQCRGGPQPLQQHVEAAIKQEPIVREVLARMSDWEQFPSLEALRDEVGKRAGEKKNNNPVGAIALWRTVAALSSEMDDQNWLAGALNEAGMICDQRGEQEAARSYYEEASRIARNVHDWNQLAMCQYNLGGLFLGKGEREAASTSLQASKEAAWRMGDAMTMRKIQELAARLNRGSS